MASPAAPSSGHTSNPASPESTAGGGGGSGGDGGGGGGASSSSPKKRKKSSAAALMKKLKGNMDTAYAKLPEGMLEGEALLLNRWSVLVEDSTLKELGVLNRYRVQQSEERKKESVLAMTGGARGRNRSWSSRAVRSRRSRSKSGRSSR